MTTTQDSPELTQQKPKEGDQKLGEWLVPSEGQGRTVTLAACAFPGTHDVTENLRRHLAFIDEAADLGADLLVFPEVSVHGYPASTHRSPEGVQAVIAGAEKVPDGPSVNAIAEKAAEHEIYVVFGINEASERGGVIYNTAVLVGPDGFVGKFSKMHLAMTEQVLWRPGADWPVFPTRIGNIGILICYDAMWPESTRELFLRGADIFAIPTAWPSGAMWDYHLDLLDKTRALENSRWAVTANYVGPFNGLDFPGASRIVNPLGRVVGAAGNEPGLGVATVDLAAGYTDAIACYCFGPRQIRDRRTETYRAIRGEIPTVVDG
jgi:predicted amidohydrolase